MTVRSDYVFDVTHITNGGYASPQVPVVVIGDRNMGRMSVTNNIEAVLADIQQEISKQGLSLSKVAVIYRDSQGRWDEIKIGDDNKFSSFGSLDQKMAMPERQRVAVRRLNKRRAK